MDCPRQSTTILNSLCTNKQTKNPVPDLSNIFRLWYLHILKGKTKCMGVLVEYLDIVLDSLLFLTTHTQIFKRLSNLGLSLHPFCYRLVLYHFSTHSLQRLMNTPAKESCNKIPFKCQLKPCCHLKSAMTLAPVCSESLLPCSHKTQECVPLTVLRPNNS